MTAKSFDNLGYLSVDIPQHLFQLLKLECSQALENNDEFTSGLTGPGVATHRYVKSPNALQELKKLVFSSIDDYRDAFEFDPSDTRTHTDGVPFELAHPWINFQKKHEFIPNHYHEGVFSYSIWIKIPYEDEGTHAGKFEFTYNSVDGQTRNQSITPVEGRMIFFPSKVFHQAYPFYTSDDYRISISGNVMLKI